MLDSSDLLKAIKGAAMDAVAQSKPTALVFGTVAGINPLSIKTESKITLSASHLYLTSAVQEEDVVMEANGYQQTYTVHKELAVGESVILLRMQGGQKFLVIDRVVGA